VTRAAAEKIMQQLPRTFKPPEDELRKVYVYRVDVAAYIEAHTFGKDQVPR
jgi:hypothetical protein